MAETVAGAWESDLLSKPPPPPRPCSSSESARGHGPPGTRGGRGDVMPGRGKGGEPHLGAGTGRARSRPGAGLR